MFVQLLASLVGLGATFYRGVSSFYFRKIFQGRKINKNDLKILVLFRCRDYFNGIIISFLIIFLRLAV